MSDLPEEIIEPVETPPEAPVEETPPQEPVEDPPVEEPGPDEPQPEEPPFEGPEDLPPAEEEEPLDPANPPEGYSVVYENGAYSVVPTVDLSLPEPVPPPIPDIDRAQLRLWMLQNKGVTWAQINDTVLAMIEDPLEQEATRIEMEDRKTFKRDHALFAVAGPLFQMSEEDIDNAFREAAEL